MLLVKVSNGWLTRSHLQFCIFKMTVSGMSPRDPYSHQCRSGETSCPYFLKNVSETFRIELLLKW